VESLGLEDEEGMQKHQHEMLRNEARCLRSVLRVVRQNAADCCKKLLHFGKGPGGRMY
jgi:hypothetical protein